MDEKFFKLILKDEYFLFKGYSVVKVDIEYCIICNSFGEFIGLI